MELGLSSACDPAGILQNLRSSMNKYRQVGGLLGAYLRSGSPTTQQIQSFLGDHLADDDLLLPIKDAVARPAFAGIQELVGTGGGSVQRDALLQDLSRSYLPEVVQNIRDLLNGVLDQSQAEAGQQKRLIDEDAIPDKTPVRELWSPYADSKRNQKLPDLSPDDYPNVPRYLLRRANASPGLSGAMVFLLAFFFAPLFGIMNRSWVLAVAPIFVALLIGVVFELVASAFGSTDGFGITGAVAGGSGAAWTANWIVSRQRRNARKIIAEVTGSPQACKR